MYFFKICFWNSSFTISTSAHFPLQISTCEHFSLETFTCEHPSLQISAYEHFSFKISTSKHLSIETSTYERFSFLLLSTFPQNFFLASTFLHFRHFSLKITSGEPFCFKVWTCQDLSIETSTLLTGTFLTIFLPASFPP